MRISIPLILMLASAVPADDWPTFQHDNQRTGVTSEALDLPLHLQWVFESPFPPAKGWALPVNDYGARKNKPNVSYDDAFRVVAAGDAAYFCSSCENRVYAIDAATGKIKWTFFTDAAPRLAPVYLGGRVYFGADDGRLYCLDAADGELVWQVDLAPTKEKMLGQGRFCSKWPVRAGAMIEDGVFYVTAGLFPAEGIYFCAIDVEDGSFIWRKRLDHAGLGPSESPQGYLLATRDSIFMTSRVAPTRWRKTDGGSIGFTTPFPEVKRSHEYRFLCGGDYAQIWKGRNIVFGQACLLGYDPDLEYRDKYRRKLKGGLILNWFNARQAVFREGQAFVATDYYVAAVRQDRLSELSKNECREFEEDVYKGLRIASYLEHLDEYDRLTKELGEDHPKVRFIKNGPLKWGLPFWKKWPKASETVFQKIAAKCEWMVPVRATESMIMAGNVLYLGGESSVHALDAATGTEVWKADVGSRVRGLAVAKGRLFVSTADGSVRCFAGGRAPEEVVRIRQEAHENLGSGFYAQTAKSIVKETGIRRGYCLILGAGTGQLAYELAKRTQLTIYGLERDGAHVRAGRDRLTSAGLYGGRVCLEQSSLKQLPFAPYNFNLVIDQSSFEGDPSPTPPEEVFRVTRPSGGVAYFGQPLKPELLAELAEQNGKIESRGRWHRIVRRMLPGARNWTHNYASPANTYSSEDERVKGPFGVLWYGEPGPRKRVERHATPPMPLVFDGVMFTQGYDLLMAYDVYNGMKYWERRLMGATRTGLPIGTSNMVVDEDGLYVVVESRQCLRLDRLTGQTLQTYLPPVKKGAKLNPWGWIAKSGGLLFGSRPRIDERRRKADRAVSDGVFTIDPASEDVVWLYEGGGIDHDGIAVAGGKVFLVQRELTKDERVRAVENTITDNTVADRKPVDRKGNPVAPDLRKIAALDAATGKPVWQHPFNATDLTLDDVVVQQGRVGVACMVKGGVLVVHGTGSLGHPHRQFLQGEFKRRALYAFDAKTGKYRWGGRLGYRKRPIIIGDTVYAEPHAWNLATGKSKMIANPLSGREQKLDFHRGYVGCSHLLGSGAAMFANKDGIACLNLGDRSGYSPFGNMTLACGLNAVPANGVFIAPEGRSGCTCATPIFTSIALHPREGESAWGVGVAEAIGTDVTVFPIQQVAINLGAPGFRTDNEGTLWLPYPARTGIGLLGKWLPTYQHSDDMCYRLDGLTTPVTGTDRPWLYTSGYQFTKPLAFRLLDKGEGPARFTVRLYFVEPEDLAEGDRVFSVAIQNKTVVSDLDVAKEADGVRKPLVREFGGIEVRSQLSIALKPTEKTPEKMPVLSAVRAIRE